MQTLSIGLYVQLAGRASEKVCSILLSNYPRASNSGSPCFWQLCALDIRELPSEIPLNTGSKQQNHCDSRTKAGWCAHLCYLKPRTVWECNFLHSKDNSFQNEQKDQFSPRSLLIWTRRLLHYITASESSGTLKTGWDAATLADSSTSHSFWQRLQEQLSLP